MGCPCLRKGITDVKERILFPFALVFLLSATEAKQGGRKGGVDAFLLIHPCFAFVNSFPLSLIT